MMDNDTECIFCSIITKNEQNILFEDDDLIVISDIKPVANCHFLIISRKHIRNAKYLTKDDKNLLEKMIERAKATLEENTADMNDIRLVFHWPPFHSVSHLHLHAISPAREMSFLNKILFKPNTWWCVTSEYVLQRISE